MDAVAEFGKAHPFSRTRRFFGVEVVKGSDSAKPLHNYNKIATNNLVSTEVYGLKLPDFNFCTVVRNLGAVSSLPTHFYAPRELEENWRDVGTSRVRAAEATSRLLTNFYALREPEETLAFVSGNEFLLPWLIILYSRVEIHFPSSKLHLKAVSDPEMDDVRLVVFVKGNYGPDEAIERLDAFDRNWSDAVPRDVDQKLTVTVEF